MVTSGSADPAERLISDDLGTFLCFLIDQDLIRTVDLIIRKNTVLKNKPPRSPTLAIVDPLIKNSGDSIADDVVDPHLTKRRKSRKRFQGGRERSES